MKKSLIFICTIFLFLGTIGIASATVIFQDNFNGENGGATSNPYYGFANWTVSDGNVDLINYSDSGLPAFSAYGSFVDMDGSNIGDAGKLTSSSMFLLDPGDYILKYDLAGRLVNEGPISYIDWVYVQVNNGSLVDASYSLGFAAPFETFENSFTLFSTTSVSISFEGEGGDWVGMLLDNIELSKVDPVPEPATMLLLGSGLIGLAGFRRKFKKA